MKILLFFPDAGSPVGEGEYNYHNIRESLLDMGHEIIDFDYLKHLKTSGSYTMHVDLKRIIEQKRPEIFIHNILGDELDKQLATYIKKDTGTTSILFCNNDIPVRNHFLDDIGYYNFVLTTNTNTYDEWKKRGQSNCMFTAWGCSPHVLPLPDKKKYDVTFVGRPYKGRPEIIGFLKKNGVDVRVWGMGWEDIAGLRDIARGYLPRYRLYEVMAASKIVLGLSWSIMDGVTPQIKRRIFECAACKGFQIATHSEQLVEYFKENREIVTYKSEKDLLSKIRYYINKDSERSEISEAAYKRAIEEHSWQRRFEKVFIDIAGRLPKNKYAVKSVEKRTKDAISVVSRPKISVLTYVYNGEKYIKDAIESILSQTYKDFEYLILDDGSTDNTAGIVREFLGDRRLRYIHQENIGKDLLHFDELVNRCIAHTTGEYINVIGSDDIYLPNKLERQIREFENDAELDIVFSDLYFVNSDGMVIPGDFKCEFSFTFTQESLLRMLFKQNIIAHPTALMKRRSIEKLGGFETGFAADYHYWLKAAPHQRFKFIDEKLIKYRVHEDGASTGSRSARIAFEESNSVISMMRDRYTILDLYPEIEYCKDKNKALHDAYIEFGKDLLLANVPQPGLALKEFTRALQHINNSIMGINNVAIAYVYLGEFEKAYELFAKLKSHPNINETMRKNIFTIEQIFAGRNKETVNFNITTETKSGSELVRYIKPYNGEKEDTKKNMYNLTYEKVENLIGCGRYEDAISELEHLLDLYPDSATVYNDIGVCSYQVGHNGSAMGYFERALQVDPNFIDAKKNLVHMYIGLDKIDEASDLLEDILKQNPDDEEALLLSADVFYGCGRYEDAFNFYEKVLYVNPDNIRAAEAIKNIKT